MAMAPPDNAASKWLLQAGEMVDHFRIMRSLGRGGMAEVYLARDTRLGRKVALKFVQPTSIGSEGAVERFLFEARATARFNHNHIVTIHAVGQHGDWPYLALEYLEGQTLRERMREQPPGVRESLRYVVAIAKALAEAHAGALVHRDLKPENVFLAKDGRLRVLDFGLAKALPVGIAPQESRVAEDPDSQQIAVDVTAVEDRMSESIAVTHAEYEMMDEDSTHRFRTEGTCGTPAYMAPEQWQKQVCGGATDSWALGVILHELLGRGKPFNEPTAAAQARKVCGPEPSPELEPSRPMPARVVELVNRCLRKQPEERPTAGEVVDTLEEVLSEVHDQRISAESPFRGLLPFDERHQHLFFGRDPEIDAFVERLREQPVLPVVGPSGAGKSSFVQAGVIPRLREHAPLVVVQMRPGAQPFLTLATRISAAQSESSSGFFPTGRGPVDSAAGEASSSSAAKRAEVVDVEDRDDQVEKLADQLHDSPQRLNLVLHKLAEQRDSSVLLFIDQLEELYTHVTDSETRRRFMNAVCAAADDPFTPVRVVFTLREEFLSRLAEGAAVREALTQITVVRSPGPEMLEQILTRPVEAVGYGYDDPGLVAEMVAAVEGELSCLPLVQFSGEKLWQGRDQQRHLLCRRVYEEMGGVAGALATHADGVLAGLSSADLRMARTMLLRLVTPEGTRRCLSRSDVIDRLPESAEHVLERLTRARLVTVRRSEREEEAELELVHESLLNNWRRLARWIEDSREELTFLSEVGQAAELWHRRGRRNEEVWSGKALEEALHTTRRLDIELPERVRAFLDSGQRRQHLRLSRRRMAAAAGFLFITVVAVVLGVQRHEARVQRDRAEKQRIEAEARHGEALYEGARAAWAQGDLLEARAKVRSSLEVNDSVDGRVLWWQLEGDPLRWRDTLDLRHHQVAVSADGSLLATSSATHEVYVFDARTREVRTLRGHEDQTLGIAFSPDGRTLAAGTFGGDVAVWDIESGELRLLKGHQAVPWYLCFTEDGSLLASGSYDHTIRLWDVTSGATVKVLEGHGDRIRRLRLSPDGSILASGGFDATLRLWSMPSGEALRTIEALQPVMALAFSPDGETIATAGGSTHRIRLWSTATGASLGELEPGHKAAIESLDYSADGRWIASGSRDRTVRLTDPATGAQEGLFDGHQGEIHMLRFGPDSDYLAVTSSDDALRLWNVGTSPRPRSAGGHEDSLWGVSVSPDGRTVATSSADSTVRLWDVATGRQTQILRGHEAAVYGIDFSADGRFLVSAGADRTVRVWDTALGEQKSVFKGHTREVFAARFSPDGASIASASVDSTVRLWDAGSGAAVMTVKGHSRPVYDLDFDAEGRLLASASFDGTVRIWQIPSGRLYKVFEGHEGNVYGVSFSPDGRLLASTGHDQTVRLWDVAAATGEVLHTFDSVPYFADFDPSGNRLAVPLAATETHVFDLEAKTALVLSGHRSSVFTASFSPDGAAVATASDDGTLRLWNAADGRLVWSAKVILQQQAMLYAHQGWVDLETGAATASSETAEWRREVEESARIGVASAATDLLCMATHDGQIEMWDMASDRLLFTESLPDVQQIMATSAACVVRTGAGRVRLCRSTGEIETLDEAGAAFATRDGEAILVGGSGRMQIYDLDSGEQTTHEVGEGVTAAVRFNDLLVVGRGWGAIEIAATRPEQEIPSFAFESTNKSAVTGLLIGPSDTLVAGYSNGLVGLWSLNSGRQLAQTRLHGPVIHLLLDRSGLYAVTELGDHLRWDLQTLLADRCEVLQSIWDKVPVTWEQGHPVHREIPEDHPCADNQ